jgi:uncharacterized protein (DUF924 family)
LFVVRFWGGAEKRQKIREFFRQRPFITGAIQWVGSNFLKTRTSTTTIEDDKTPGKHLETSSLGNPNQLCIQSLERVRNNQVSINSVLKYWFGSGTPDQNQKNLWMIAASSEKLRLKVDQEITDKFEELLIALVADDRESQKSNLWNELCIDRDGVFGANGKIAAIIVLDQFSRHIRRRYEISEENLSRLPSKEVLDSLAFETSKLFVEAHQNEIKCGMIPLPMYIFSLMPYRHASKIDTLQYVQNRVEELAALNSQMEAMLGRFRKATNRRLAVLQDEARRRGKTAPIEATTATGKSGTFGFSDEDILETFQFDADMAPVINFQVHKTITSFLAKVGIHPSSADGKQTAPSAVIVSLSGGVDSMVIASVLSNLKRSCGFNLKVIAGKKYCWFAMR